MLSSRNRRTPRRRSLVAALLALGLGACKSESLTPTAPPPAAPEIGSTPGEMPAVVLARATFRNANGYRTVGGARLEETGGNLVLYLEEDFETDRSNALDVRLCRRRGCGEGALPLGDLIRFRGEQSYAVPGGDSSYEFVVIWCTAVDLAFGTGRLE